MAAGPVKFLDFAQAVNFMVPGHCDFTRPIATGGIFDRYAATRVNWLPCLFQQALRKCIKFVGKSYNLPDPTWQVGRKPQQSSRNSLVGSIIACSECRYKFRLRERINTVAAPMVFGLARGQ